MKFIIILLLLYTSIAYAEDLQFENIDLDQINKLLPAKWYVSEVSKVDVPVGWSRISGDRGLKLTISRSPYSFKLGETKSGDLEVWHPKFTFCIMPENFSGKSANDVLFEKGKIDSPVYPPHKAMLVLSKIQKLDSYFLFYNSATFSDWENPESLFDQILIKNKNP